jgi:hypothetical protein
MRRLSVLGVALALAATTTARGSGVRQTVPSNSRGAKTYLAPAPSRAVAPAAARLRPVSRRPPIGPRVKVYSLPLNRRAPLPFKPFQVRNLGTGRVISPQTVLTLRGGQKLKAGAYVARLNLLEKRLNVRGYTLRSPRLLPSAVLGSRHPGEKRLTLAPRSPYRTALLTPRVGNSLPRGGQGGAPTVPSVAGTTVPVASQGSQGGAAAGGSPTSREATPPSEEAGFVDGSQSSADVPSDSEVSVGVNDGNVDMVSQSSEDVPSDSEIIFDFVLDNTPDDGGPLPPDLQGVLDDLNDVVNGLGDTFSPDAKEALDDLPPDSPLDDLTKPSSDGTPFELPPEPIDYSEDDLFNQVLGITPGQPGNTDCPDYIDKPDAGGEPDTGGQPDTGGEYPNPDGPDPVGPAGPLSYPTPDGPPGGPVGIVAGAIAGALGFAS